MCASSRVVVVLPLVPVTAGSESGWVFLKQHIEYRFRHVAGNAAARRNVHPKTWGGVNYNHPIHFPQGRLISGVTISIPAMSDQ